jgi:hypothetical protein
MGYASPLFSYIPEGVLQHVTSDRQQLVGKTRIKNETQEARQAWEAIIKKTSEIELLEPAPVIHDKCNSRSNVRRDTYMSI